MSDYKQMICDDCEDIPIDYYISTWFPELKLRYFFLPHDEDNIGYLFIYKYKNIIYGPYNYNVDKKMDNLFNSYNKDYNIFINETQKHCEDYGDCKEEEEEEKENKKKSSHKFFQEKLEIFNFKNIKNKKYYFLVEHDMDNQQIMHSNALIYSKLNNTLYRFNPNFESKCDSYYIHDFFNTQLKLNNINYKHLNIYPQYYQKDIYSGTCLWWSSFIIFYLIKKNKLNNIDILLETLNYSIYKKNIFTEIIYKFIQFVLSNEKKYKSFIENILKL